MTSHAGWGGIVILIIHRLGYCYIIRENSKSEATKLMQNINLSEKKKDNY